MCALHLVPMLFGTAMRTSFNIYSCIYSSSFKTQLAITTCTYRVEDLVTRWKYMFTTSSKFAYLSFLRKPGDERSLILGVASVDMFFTVWPFALTLHSTFPESLSLKRVRWIENWLNVKKIDQNIPISFWNHWLTLGQLFVRHDSDKYKGHSPICYTDNVVVADKKHWMNNKKTHSEHNLNTNCVVWCLLCESKHLH